MPLNERRVPTVQTRITFRILHRDVPLRTVLLVGGWALLLLLAGSWFRLPLRGWLFLVPASLFVLLPALLWKPRGLLPEEWLRRKVRTLWVPRRMVWRPLRLEDEEERPYGVAVRPLSFEEDKS